VSFLTLDDEDSVVTIMELIDERIGQWRPRGSAIVEERCESAELFRSDFPPNFSTPFGIAKQTKRDPQTEFRFRKRNALPNASKRAMAMESVVEFFGLRFAAKFFAAASLVAPSLAAAALLAALLAAALAVRRSEIDLHRALPGAVNDYSYARDSDLRFSKMLGVWPPFTGRTILQCKAVSAVANCLGRALVCCARWSGFDGSHRVLRMVAAWIAARGAALKRK
jgi:hypothetical protein